jgi:beta-phosphoglucomutase-like phosphatase (HAD superfamily)
MDGLLLDTETVYQAAMIEAGQAFGIDFTAATYRSMVGKTNPESAVMLRELYGEAFPSRRISPAPGATSRPSSRPRCG